MTLPLIHALRQAQGMERELIRTAITVAGDEEAPEPDFARINGCIDATGRIEYTRERARAESRAAVAALAPVPASRLPGRPAGLAEVAVGAGTADLGGKWKPRERSLKLPRPRCRDVAQPGRALRSGRRVSQVQILPPHEANAQLHFMAWPVQRHDRRTGSGRRVLIDRLSAGRSPFQRHFANRPVLADREFLPTLACQPRPTLTK